MRLTLAAIEKPHSKKPQHLEIDIKQIGEALNDKETTLKMAHGIIAEKTKNWEQSEEGSLVKKMMSIWGDIVVKKNVEDIFTYSQSPIERLFLNSVHFFGLIHDFRTFVFTPRNISISHLLDRYKLMKKSMAKLRKTIKENNPEIDNISVDIEMLKMVEESSDKEFSELVKWHHTTYELLDWKNSFHFTLQTFLEDVKVGNKKVKPDITIWIPENRNFKLVVECDGFQFHSNKKTFTVDRQKDRELQRKGYKIHRYSGTEIYNQPLETAFDLCNYLFLEREKLQLKDKTSK